MHTRTILFGNDGSHDKYTAYQINLESQINLLRTSRNILLLVVEVLFCVFAF